VLDGAGAEDAVGVPMLVGLCAEVVNRGGGGNSRDGVIVRSRSDSIGGGAGACASNACVRVNGSDGKLGRGGGAGGNCVPNPCVCITDSTGKLGRGGGAGGSCVPNPCVCITDSTGKLGRGGGAGGNCAGGPPAESAAWVWIKLPRRCRPVV
jgi:hypothetical protein